MVIIHISYDQEHFIFSNFYDGSKAYSDSDFPNYLSLRDNIGKWIIDHNISVMVSCDIEDIDLQDCKSIFDLSDFLNDEYFICPIDQIENGIFGETSGDVSLFFENEEEALLFKMTWL